MLLRKSNNRVVGGTLARRFSDWRNRARDPSLTAMLITQMTLVVFAAPYAASGYRDWEIAYDLFRAFIGFLTALISRGRIMTGISIVGIGLIVTGNAFSLLQPSVYTVQLTHFGAIVGSVVISIVVGRAVAAPGPITAHRVMGAIVLYLNFGIVAAAIYRMIWDFYPTAFQGMAPDTTPPQATGALVYFSFVTLTTAGYGDIVPVNAFARGLANLESIIGQLYPATLLARFVTLQLETRRR